MTKGPATPKVSSQGFRHALGRFASGVTVLTVRGEHGQPHGMTASAFCSVSLEPPLVLVCVDHQARTHTLMKKTEWFGINVLRDDQREFSEYFARRERDSEQAGAERIGVRYKQTSNGTPMLERSLVEIECRLVAAHEAGDHTVYVGEAEELHYHEGEPLIYFRGAYRALCAEKHKE
jgi:flavin reductase (DIM6/NTAB) family NADH-FMN oxidoreductase RutF